MIKWTNDKNGQSGTVTDQIGALMQQDIAHKGLRFEPIEAPKIPVVKPPETAETAEKRAQPKT